MRVLCDQNVDKRYIDALSAAAGFQVARTRDLLDSRASDRDIATFAGANDWVVLTSDRDFFELASLCGVVYYSQFDAAPAGDVLAALRAIRDAYDDPADILEVVPGAWV
jgi:hypothetical protein